MYILLDISIFSSLRNEVLFYVIFSQIIVVVLLFNLTFVVMDILLASTLLYDVLFMYISYLK